jgi:hypothetical protein
MFLLLPHTNTVELLKHQACSMPAWLQSLGLMAEEKLMKFSLAKV